MLQNTSRARQLKYICKYLTSKGLLKNKLNIKSIISKIKRTEK